MLYVGLDIHLKWISVCVLAENGKRLRRERVGDASELVRLRTMPGVGLRTAEAVAAYLDDAERFASSKQVGAYFGLVRVMWSMLRHQQSWQESVAAAV